MNDDEREQWEADNLPTKNLETGAIGFPVDGVTRWAGRVDGECPWDHGKLTTEPACPNCGLTLGQFFAQD